MVKKKTRGLGALSETLFPALPQDILELDELWSFVKSKAHRVWLWIALCRRTGQVVAFHLGNRDEKNARAFYDKFPSQYAACRTRSDKLHAYSIISRYAHKKCTKKSGETAHVEAFNTILRARVGRLVRKNCAFSKSLENHEAAISCFINSHNTKQLSAK